MADPMIGQEFGKLLVIRRQPVTGKRHMYLCGCECGTQMIVPKKHLERGVIRSCGCGKNRQKNLAGFKFGDLQVLGFANPIDGQDAVICKCLRCGKQHAVKRAFLLVGAEDLCGCGLVNVREKHPEERSAWHGMIGRCDSDHPRYGGRGIKVCAGWRESFDSFVRIIGKRPSPEFSVDRKDNDGHYSCGECAECSANGWPMNCRWATMREQNLNKINTRKARWKGELLPIAIIAERQSVPYLKLVDMISEETDAEPFVAKIKEGATD